MVSHSLFSLAVPDLQNGMGLQGGES